MEDRLDIISALEEEKEALQLKIKSIEVTILTLKQSYSYTDTTYQPGSDLKRHNGNGNVKVADPKKIYASIKGNKERAGHILKSAGKFLHMRQIVAIARSLEPNSDAEAVRKQISQGIYALSKLGKIINKEVGSKVNTFWGSKNWLDEKGGIKPEHMYDEGELATKGEEIEI